MVRLLATIFLIVFNCILGCAKLRLANPTVEYEREPMSINSPNPRLSWQLVSDKNGTRQKAFRIVVTDETRREVWNSGRVNSDKSVNVVYEGEPLQPETRYQWTVTVWDSHSQSASCTSWFETAIADWDDAKWIGGGAEAMPFYCQYLPVFQIGYSVMAYNKAQKVGFIYGANDMRLMDGNKNILGVANRQDQSYVKVEMSADSLRLYRVGYIPDDRSDRSLKSFAMPSGFDITQRHDVKISSVSGSTVIEIDGKEIGKADINPVGRGGDYTAFPVVGHIGYDVGEGQWAMFDDVRVMNYRSPHNVLSRNRFGKITGRSIIRPAETGATMLRRDFRITGKPRKARLYVTARGIYDFYLNGLHVGNDFLNPGLTQYNKTHFFQTYDITGLLHEGDNAAGAVLNEGWWSGAISFEPANWNWFGDRQALLACIKIWYDDGRQQVIATAPGEWQMSNDGPVRYGSLFQGEVYDARREMDGWASAGFSADGWMPAEEVRLEETVTDKPVSGWPLSNDYSQWRLLPQTGNPVRAFKILKALGMEEPREGVFLYDMGQNFAGVPSVTLRGLKSGQQVVMRFAEVKYPSMPQYGGNEGMAMLENIRAAMAQDIYIARGDSAETFTPRSTYHGYRYVEITGVSAPPALEGVCGIVLSSVDSFTAGYQSSDTLLNRFVDNVKYSTLSNVFSVPTDCPQRNERMGWSGDVSVFAPAMSYLFNACRFLNRHTAALRDTQEPDGAFPPIAPCGGGFGGPLWQSAGIVIPWQNYIQYGDTATMSENYQAMKRYIEMVLDKYIDPSDGHFRGTGTWSDLGDWLGPQNRKNDNTLLFDCYLAYELGLMSRIAGILGMKDDAEKFAGMRDRRVRFINDHYIDSLTGRTIGTGTGKRESTWTGFVGPVPKGSPIDTHTSYAVPLALGVVDDAVRGLVSGNLAKAVARPSEGDDGRIYPAYSLMTGFVGTPWISYALSGNGYTDEAYRLLTNTRYPSWLYPVTQGATTIWERLDSYTHEKGFGRNNSMNSFNHYAFGCVFDWLMQCSAGISRDIQSPGFKHFFLCPVADRTGHLSHAHAYYDSMYGRIESGWETDGSRTSYTFTIPANTTATLTLPVRSGERVSRCSKGIQPIVTAEGVVCELGSGTYTVETTAGR